MNSKIQSTLFTLCLAGLLAFACEYEDDDKDNNGFQFNGDGDSDAGSGPKDTTGLGGDIEDVKDSAPDVCHTYCEKKYMCEWQEKEGPEAQNAKDWHEGACIMECAYTVAKGTFALDQDADYMAQISGGDFQDYMECIMNSGLMVCEDITYAIDSDLFVEQDLCEEYNSCLEELGLIGYITVQWDSDTEVCENNGDWHILGM